MTPRAWADEVRATWLGHQKKRQKLHNEVCRWLALQRSLGKGKTHLLGPLLVDPACDNVVALGISGQWFACSTLMAQIGELVLCAESGDVLAIVAADRWRRDVNHDSWKDIQAINAIRNLLCHPGTMKMPEVCSHIRSFEMERIEFARKLDSDWSVTRTREFAEYVLAKLNAAGEQVLKRHRL